jgi:hypothetical protein
VRVSVVPLRPLPGYRVPDIAAGLGERRPDPVVTGSAIPPAVTIRIAKRPAPIRAAIVHPRPAAAPIERIDMAQTAPACGGDEPRIRNYAARIAGSVGAGPSDDLKLFDSDGRALANLPAVMLAMSSVELGYLYADPALIEGAVRRLALLSPLPGAPSAGTEHAAPP